MSDQFQRSNSNELLTGKKTELNQTNNIGKDPWLIYFRRLFTLDSFKTPNFVTNYKIQFVTKFLLLLLFSEG